MANNGIDIGEGCVHIIDGSFDGLLTSIFEAHASKRFPSGVYGKDAYQNSLCETPVLIGTDEAKAARVRNGIFRTLGEQAYDNAWKAYLSCDQDRFTKISRYITFGFKIGADINDRLTEPAVFDILAICRLVGRESNKLTGFIRFSVMENNMQYAEITPEHNQIPMLMQHFTVRLKGIPFVLYDTGRKIAGVYDTREWYIVDAEGLELPKLSEDEELVRSLWRTFFNTIAIEARVNLKLQRNFMPLRYRRNMTETNY